MKLLWVFPFVWLVTLDQAASVFFKQSPSQRANKVRPGPPGPGPGPGPGGRPPRNNPHHHHPPPLQPPYPSGHPLPPPNFNPNNLHASHSMNHNQIVPNNNRPPQQHHPHNNPKNHPSHHPHHHGPPPPGNRHGQGNGHGHGRPPPSHPHHKYHPQHPPKNFNSFPPPGNGNPGPGRFFPKPSSSNRHPHRVRPPPPPLRPPHHPLNGHRNHQSPPPPPPPPHHHPHQHQQPPTHPLNHNSNHNSNPNSNQVVNNGNIFNGNGPPDIFKQSEIPESFKNMENVINQQHHHSQDIHNHNHGPSSTFSSGNPHDNKNQHNSPLPFTITKPSFETAFPLTSGAISNSIDTIPQPTIQPAPHIILNPNPGPFGSLGISLATGQFHDPENLNQILASMEAHGQNNLFPGPEPEPEPGGDNDNEHGWTAATYKGWRPVPKPPSYYTDPQKQNPNQNQNQNQHQHLQLQPHSSPSQHFPVSFLPYPASSATPFTTEQYQYRDVGGKHKKLMMTTLFRDNVKSVKPESPIKLNPLEFDIIQSHNSSHSAQSQNSNHPTSASNQNSHNIRPSFPLPPSGSSNSNSHANANSNNDGGSSHHNLVSSQSEDTPVRKPFSRFRTTSAAPINDAHEALHHSNRPNGQSNAVLNKHKSKRPKLERPLLNLNQNQNQNRQKLRNQHQNQNPDESDDVGPRPRPPKVTVPNSSESIGRPLNHHLMKNQLHKQKQRNRTRGGNPKIPLDSNSNQNSNLKKPDAYVSSEEVGWKSHVQQQQPVSPYSQESSNESLRPPPGPGPNGSSINFPHPHLYGAGYYGDGDGHGHPLAPPLTFFDALKHPFFNDGSYAAPPVTVVPRNGNKANGPGGGHANLGSGSGQSSENIQSIKATTPSIFQGGERAGPVRKKKVRTQQNPTQNLNHQNQNQQRESGKENEKEKEHHPQRPQQQQQQQQNVQKEEHKVQGINYNPPLVNIHNNGAVVGSNEDSGLLYTPQGKFYFPSEFTEMSNSGEHQAVSFMTIPGSRPQVISHQALKFIQNQNLQQQQQQKPHQNQHHQNHIFHSNPQQPQHLNGNNNNDNGNRHYSSYPINILKSSNFPPPPHSHSNNVSPSTPPFVHYSSSSSTPPGFPQAGPSTTPNNPHHQQRQQKYIPGLGPGPEFATIRNNIIQQNNSPFTPNPNLHNLTFSAQYGSGPGTVHLNKFANHGEIYQRQRQPSTMNPKYQNQNQNQAASLSSVEQSETIPMDFLNHLQPILLGETSVSISPATSLPTPTNHQSTSTLRSTYPSSMSSSPSTTPHSYHSPNVHPYGRQYFEDFFKPFQSHEHYHIPPGHPQPQSQSQEQSSSSTEKHTYPSSSSGEQNEGHKPKITFPHNNKNQHQYQYQYQSNSHPFDSHKSPSVEFEQFLQRQKEPNLYIPPTQFQYQIENDINFNHQTNSPIFSSVSPVQDFSRIVTTISPILEQDLYFRAKSPKVRGKLKAGNSNPNEDENGNGNEKIKIHDFIDYPSSSSTSTESQPQPEYSSSMEPETVTIDHPDPDQVYILNPGPDPYPAPSTGATPTVFTLKPEPDILNQNDSEEETSPSLFSTTKNYRPKPKFQSQSKHPSQEIRTTLRPVHHRHRPTPATPSKPSTPSSSFGFERENSSSSNKVGSAFHESESIKLTTTTTTYAPASSETLWIGLNSLNLNENGGQGQAQGEGQERSQRYSHFDHIIPRNPFSSDSSNENVHDSSYNENDNSEDENNIPNSFRSRSRYKKLSLSMVKSSGSTTTTASATPTTLPPSSSEVSTATEDQDQSEVPSTTVTSKRYVKRRRPPGPGSGLYGHEHSGQLSRGAPDHGPNGKRNFSSKVSQNQNVSLSSSASEEVAEKTEKDGIRSRNPDVIRKQKLPKHQADQIKDNGLTSDPPITTHRPSTRRFKPTTQASLGIVSNEEIVTQPFIYPKRKLFQKERIRNFPPAAARLGLPAKDNSSNSHHNNHKHDQEKEESINHHVALKNETNHNRNNHHSAGSELVLKRKDKKDRVVVTMSSSISSSSEILQHGDLSPVLVPVPNRSHHLVTPGSGSGNAYGQLHRPLKRPLQNKLQLNRSINNGAAEVEKVSVSPVYRKNPHHASSTASTTTTTVKSVVVGPQFEFLASPAPSAKALTSVEKEISNIDKGREGGMTEGQGHQPQQPHQESSVEMLPEPAALSGPGPGPAPSFPLQQPEELEMKLAEHLQPKQLDRALVARPRFINDNNSPFHPLSHLMSMQMLSSSPQQQQFQLQLQLQQQAPPIYPNQYSVIENVSPGHDPEMSSTSISTPTLPLTSTTTMTAKQEEVHLVANTTANTNVIKSVPPRPASS